MPIQAALIIVTGILVTCTGLACLYLALQSRIKLKDSFITTGWLLLVAAALVWIELSGVRFGLALALTVPVLLLALFGIAGLVLKTGQQS